MASFIQVDFFFCPDGNVRWFQQCANITCGAELGKSVHETMQMLTEAYDAAAVKIFN